MNPCKDCLERWVKNGTNCHSVCERYIAFDLQNKARLRAKALEQDCIVIHPRKSLKKNRKRYSVTASEQ